MEELAQWLLRDERFGWAVSEADADGVPVMTVLAETSVFAAAARRGRLYLTNKRAEQARAQHS